MYQWIFIRHLATDKNHKDYDASPDLQKRVRARKNVRIQVNAEGHAQGRLLQERFASYLAARAATGSVAFYHSDLERTRTTTSYLLKSLEPHDGLFSVHHVRGRKHIRDIDHGLVNDMPFQKAMGLFPEYEREIAARGYLDARPPLGESHRDAMPRIREFLDALSQVRSHAVVVTHLSTLILIRGILENLADDLIVSMLAGDHPPNGSATRYSFDPDSGACFLEEASVLPWKAEPRQAVASMGHIPNARKG